MVWVFKYRLTLVNDVICTDYNTKYLIYEYVITANGVYFENIWQGTTKSPGKITVAFYSGIFCYSGW